MHSLNNIGAVILAAGLSTRMQQFKPLLPFAEGTVIEQAIHSILSCGIKQLTVVTGFHSAEVVQVVGKLHVACIVNANYHQGMFSSVMAGLQSCDESTEAILLLPGDMPLVKRHTIRRVIRAYDKSGADVVYPVFEGQRGHPPLISRRCFPAILQGGPTDTLRTILSRFEPAAAEVEVMDAGIVTDVDTPADYQDAIRRYALRHCPTVSECCALLARLKTPSHIVKHGLAVAKVAQKLAICLRKAGVECNQDYILAAAVLHDIAKRRPNHAQAGSRLLSRIGYQPVANIISGHTDIWFQAGDPINEAAVLYLADKLVQQDSIVTLQERFQPALSRYGAEPQNLAAVRRRLSWAEAIQTQIESVTGVAVDNLCHRGLEGEL